MPGYRFCRSDDVPLLVAAHNLCWVPHFGAASAISVEDFKRGIRELGLWSSSCMVAFEGDDPIGVLLAAKRDGEANYVWRLAVKPGWERKGHGRHLLTSLTDKAAILGPPRVVAEIPEGWAGARTFVERAGFAAEATYVDFADDAGVLSAASDPSSASLLVPVTLDELLEHGALDATVRRSWSRSVTALRARASEIRGLAIATDRIEAHVLFRDDAGGARHILSLGAAPGSPARLLAVVLDHVRAGGRPLVVPRIADEEARFTELATLGFRRGDATIGYAAVRA